MLTPAYPSPKHTDTGIKITVVTPLRLKEAGKPRPRLRVCDQCKTGWQSRHIHTVLHLPRQHLPGQIASKAPTMVATAPQRLPGVRQAPRAVARERDTARQKCPNVLRGKSAPSTPRCSHARPLTRSVGSSGRTSACNGCPAWRSNPHYFASCTAGTTAWAPAPRRPSRPSPLARRGR